MGLGLAQRVDQLTGTRSAVQKHRFGLRLHTNVPSWNQSASTIGQNKEAVLFTVSGISGSSPEANVTVPPGSSYGVRHLGANDGGDGPDPSPDLSGIPPVSGPEITPQTPAEQVRYDLALELLDDVRRLDAQTKESHRRIRVAVKASGTSLTDVYGVGPIIAAQIIGYTGDARRFANRDAFASYNGTAPIEWSSGGRVVHRLSRRGNRRLNHALHMAAITQIRNPGTDGRIYFERKVAEGKTKKEALRSLKRQVSNAVYRQLLLDVERGPGGH